MTQLAEVLFAQTEQRRAIELCVPANIVVGMGMQILPVAILPHFLGAVLALQVYNRRTPVVLFARDIVAPFEKKDLLSGRRQLGGERSAPGAGSDDDDVVMVIGHSGLRIGS